MIAAAQNSRQDGYWEPEHGRFTKLNHFYQRQIKKVLQLTAIQHCMIVFLLDGSVGWHERTARISNQEFADHVGVSVSTIIRNKQTLANLGLLVVLEQGTGKIKTKLTIDLDCEIGLSERAKSLGISKAQLISDIQAGRIKQTDRPALRIVGAPEPKIIPAANPPENSHPSPEAEEIDKPSSEEKKSPENQASTAFRVVTVTPPLKREEASSGSEDCVVKPNKDAVIIDTPPDSVKPTAAEKEKKRRNTIGVVCYFFSYFFQIILARQLVGWYIKTYGVDAVLDKLRMMRRQMSRGLKFKNPGGWFRSALKNDYQLSKWDTVKIKADEASKREEVRSLEESRRKAEEERKDAERLARGEEVKRGMTDVGRENLKASAYKRMEGKGAKVEFINPAAIAVVENEILSERGLLTDAA